MTGFAKKVVAPLREMPRVNRPNVTKPEKTR
jgi:hypothetical protein